MKYTEMLSDQNLERVFLTSALFGIGSAVLVPVLLPVAMTGLVGSQAIFWGRQLSTKLQEGDLSEAEDN